MGEGGYARASARALLDSTVQRLIRSNVNYASFAKSADTKPGDHAGHSFKQTRRYSVIGSWLTRKWPVRRPGRGHSASNKSLILHSVWIPDGLAEKLNKYLEMI